MAAPALVCRGCGAVASADAPYPFRCPAARDGDDIDHVLARVLDPGLDALPETGDPNPFIRFRHFMHSWQLARARGMEDAAYCDLVRSLDARVARVDGKGFVMTPVVAAPGLAAALGIDGGAVWIKDETGNVAGSHKGRHLMGVLIHLEVASALGLAPESDRARRPLAIASCGNAALAAAVLAAAGERALDVFVPEWVDPGVRVGLEALGARIHVCPRRAGEAGDPCHLRFREAVARGALAFCCQGSECGIAIDGGRTLAYELVAALRARGVGIDRVFLQVGGGALASACVQGLEDCVALGALATMPRVHAVQTEGAAPLARAMAAARIRLGEAVGAQAVERVVSDAMRERGSFMWPWEVTPYSAATGILDDETYDWAAVVRGMLLGGGSAIVADEARVLDAAELAARATTISVGATGAAGLAGALQLIAVGEGPAPDEQLVFFFTGGY